MTERASLLAGLAAAGMLLWGCGRPPDARGVVLITLDTTRADRLGCYGYDGAATPNLDSLAGSSAVFEQAQSPVPVTLPSHASMFTGLYPARHGVRYNGMFELSEASVTVAEVLRDAGWATGAVPASFSVTASTGLAQGFATYRDLFTEPGADGLAPDAERKAAEVVDLGIAWLEEHRQGPYFLWLHIWDPHFRYEPPFPFSSTFRERPYDGEIAYADRELGRLFSRLRELGLWDDALIVVAGDHGEGLYEHGERLHANLVYQSTLHVPFLIKPPGGGDGARISEPVSIVDVAPTILDYAGLRMPSPVDGISLRETVEGGAPPRRALHHESLAGSLVYGWSPLEGIRRGRWKYTRSSDPELFDLEADPREETNVRASEAGVVADLEALLEEDLADWSAIEGGSTAAAVPVDAQTLERLASLGYVGGTMSEASAGGPHPRSMIHLEGVVLRGRSAQEGGRFAEALEAWERILQEDPDNRFVLWSAARSANLMGDPARAGDYARRLVDRYPEFQPGVILLGELLVARGGVAEAIRVFERGLEQHPASDALSYRLSLALLTAGETMRAEELLDEALGRGAEDPLFPLAKAVCRARAGDAGMALALVRQGVAAGYEDVETLRSEPLLAPLRALPGFESAIAGATPKDAGPS